MLTRRSLLSFLGFGAPAAATVAIIPSLAHAGDGGTTLQPGTLFTGLDQKGMHWFDQALGVKKPGGITISTIEGMPGEVEWALWRNKELGHNIWLCYCDGVEMGSWVHAASEEHGYVWRDVAGDDGMPILGMDEWVSEIVYGDVVLVKSNVDELKHLEMTGQIPVVEYGKA